MKPYIKPSNHNTKELRPKTIAHGSAHFGYNTKGYKESVRVVKRKYKKALRHESKLAIRNATIEASLG